MRWMLVLALCGFPLSALSEQPAIEILGVDIRQGMTEDEVRDLIPSSAINEIQKGAAAPDEVEIWSVARHTEVSGSIEFENGRVVSATRNWRVSADRGAYELFVFLHDTLARLTMGGDYTCAAIMTYSPQQIFPQHETVFVLPDRIVEIGTASHSGDESGSVVIRESLRRNPVPAGEKVHAGMDKAPHCVFRE